MENQERDEDTLPSSDVPVVTESADSRSEAQNETVAEIPPIVEKTALDALSEEATLAADQEAAPAVVPAVAEEVVALREEAPTTIVAKAASVVERESVAPAAAEKGVVEPEAAPAVDENVLVAASEEEAEARSADEPAENVTDERDLSTSSEITKAKENDKPSPASLGREKDEHGRGRSSASLGRSAPGVPKANDQDPPLVEADHEGRWFEAIEKKDCLSLMALLEAEGVDASRVSFCRKTGEQGRTALHVAAMQGCFRLAKQVIDLICIGKIKSVVGEGGILKIRIFSLSRSENGFIEHKDSRSRLTAFEMADDIIGNTSIAQYIRYVMKRKRGRMQEEYAGSGLYEAYAGTQWYTALAQGDCERLLLLLQSNSRYLLETWKGLSVLQVAIWKGDENLVKMVVHAFRRGKRHPIIYWARESYFPAELTWEALERGGRPRHRLKEMTKKDLTKIRLAESAVDLAERFGRDEMKVLLQNRGDDDHFVRSHSEHKSRQKVLWSLYEHSVFETDVTKPNITKPLESELPEFAVILDLAEVIEQCWNETVNVDECNAAFLKDVDYNFEDKRSLRYSILRFHYACKHPQQFTDFILKTVDQFSAVDFASVNAIYDGQGRTPIHTWVDYYNPDCPFYNLIFHQYLTFRPRESSNYFCDSRGRHALVRAIVNQYLNKETKVFTHLFKDFQMFLRYWKPSPNVYLLFCGALLFHEEPMLLNLIRPGNERLILETLRTRFHLKSHSRDVQTLHVVAAWGNQSILRLCLKIFDPMIEDAYGRTALHYAADASILEFFPPPRAFYCSIENSRKVEEQWKKEREEELIESNVKPDAQLDLNRNAHVRRKACILLLLQAGVDLSQEDKRGNIADPGTSYDASFQSWWYETLAKDTVDKKNSFNQAGNALSVVGTLVAATSYIGPLQPPLSYTHDAHNGYVDTSKSLVNVFMMSNTLAFYLAVASVMFAVVPSLPMPQEGVIDELRRARHTVSASLFLLLAAIACILVSFGAASAVVVDSEHYYGAHDNLLTPSVIGWFFCLIAIVSFFIRVMRLVCYRNLIVRRIYKFSFADFCKKEISLICLTVWWGVRFVVQYIPLYIYRERSIRKGMIKVRRVWLSRYAYIQKRVYS